MKPFLLGRKSHATDALRRPHSHPAQPTPGTVSAAPAGPNVEVVKEGDKIVRLIVTCSCGERLEVECLYPVGG